MQGRIKRILIILLSALILSVSVMPQPVYASSLASTKYTGKAVVKVNSNMPKFTKNQKKLKKFSIKYSKLDSLGRCGKVTAVLTKKKMAKGSRVSIGMYKPSGWPEKIGNAKYDFIDGKYLFNRSHLLGWQFYGNKTNNKKNLITGTRQLNAGKNSMLTYENKVANYLKKHKKNHVVYRVTPHYKGKEKIPRGVQMEAWSVEDKGKLHFNVYIHNVQDGVNINYNNGASSSTYVEPEPEPIFPETGDEILFLNINTGKFHRQSCRYSTGNNIEQTNLSAEQLISDGYSPCQICHPES